MNFSFVAVLLIHIIIDQDHPWVLSNIALQGMLFERSVGCTLGEKWRMFLWAVLPLEQLQRDVNSNGGEKH